MQVGDTVRALLETLANSADELHIRAHIEQHGARGAH